ncbi:MAG TPA: outer membrane beta-barrel protein [Pseudolabrys sp.]|nr:outer membrane beta-barrel protein [Pseudolabrys sp.]
MRKRHWPEYDPVGIRYGSWMFTPSLTVSPYYDSNVFSSNVNKRSDFVTGVNPNLHAQTLWERHGIDLQFDSKSLFYAQNPGLNQTDATFKGAAHYDISRSTSILTSWQIAHLNEGVGTLSSPSGAVAPTPYNLFSGDVTVRQEFNRLTASGGARVDSYQWGTTHAQDGSTIDQSNRDGQIYAGHSRLDYAVSPKLDIFSAVEINRRDIRGNPGQPFGSDGYRVWSGSVVELTHLITGEFALGYAGQHFDSPLNPNIQGAIYRAILRWSPTRRIEVNFTTERMVTQTADTSVQSLYATLYKLGTDYELRRNMILSLSGTFEDDRFQQGDARHDNVYAADAALKYALNPFASISLWYRYIHRASSLPLTGYDRQQVGIDVKAQF